MSIRVHETSFFYFLSYFFKSCNHLRFFGIFLYQYVSSCLCFFSFKMPERYLIELKYSKNIFFYYIHTSLRIYKFCARILLYINLILNLFHCILKSLLYVDQHTLFYSQHISTVGSIFFNFHACYY